MGPLEITSAITAVGHVTNMLRAAADSAKALGKTEIISQLMDAQLAMMKLSQDYQQLFDENRELKRQILELNDKLNLKASLKFQQPFYFAEGDPEPFCPKCWETDGKPIHLSSQYELYGSQTRQCRTCKIQYPVS